MHAFGQVLNVLDDDAEQSGVVFLRGFHLLDFAGEVFVAGQHFAKFYEGADDNDIHLDGARAVKESPYGTTIAHGFLTLSMVSRFLSEIIRFQNPVRLTVNYGLNHVRFPAPVPVGSRIRGSIAMHVFKDLSDSVEAIYGVTIERENSEKPACVAEWIVRYYL